MKNTMRRLLATLLSVLMLISCLPVSAIAEAVDSLAPEEDSGAKEPEVVTYVDQSDPVGIDVPISPAAATTFDVKMVMFSGEISAYDKGTSLSNEIQIQRDGKDDKPNGYRFWVTITNKTNANLTLETDALFTINGVRDTQIHPRDLGKSAGEARTISGGLENYVDAVNKPSWITTKSDPNRYDGRTSLGTVTIPAKQTVYLKQNSRLDTHYLGVDYVNPGDKIENSITVWNPANDSEKTTVSLQGTITDTYAFVVKQEYQIVEPESEQESEDWNAFPGTVKSGQLVRFGVSVENKGNSEAKYQVANDVDALGSFVLALESAADGVAWDAATNELTLSGGKSARLISGEYALKVSETSSYLNTVEVTSDNKTVKRTASLIVEPVPVRFSTWTKYVYNGVENAGTSGSILSSSAGDDGIQVEDIQYKIEITNEDSEPINLKFDALMLKLRHEGTEEKILSTEAKIELEGSETQSYALEEGQDASWESESMQLSIAGGKTAVLVWKDTISTAMTTGDVLTLYYTVHDEDYPDATVSGAMPIEIIAPDNHKLGRMTFDFTVVDKEIEDGTEFKFTVVSWNDDSGAKTEATSKAAIFSGNVISGESTATIGNGGRGTVFTVPVKKQADGYTATGGFEVYVNLGAPYAIRPCDSSGKILLTEKEVTPGTAFTTQSNGKRNVEYSVCFADDDGNKNNARATVNLPGDGNGGYLTEFEDEEFKKSRDWGKSGDAETDLSNYYLQDNTYIYYTAQYYYIQNYVADLDDEDGTPVEESTFASDEAYKGYVPVGTPIPVTLRTTAPTPDPVPNETNELAPFTPAPALNDNRNYPDAQTPRATMPPELIKDEPDATAYANLKYVSGSPTVEPSPTPDANGNIKEFDGLTHVNERVPNTKYLDGQKTVNKNLVIPGDTIPVFWDRILKFAFTQNDGRNITVEDFESNYGEPGYIRQRKITYETIYEAWQALNGQGNATVKDLLIEDAWKDDRTTSVKFVNNAASNQKAKAMYALYAVNADVEEDTSAEIASISAKDNFTFTGSIDDATQSVAINKIKNEANVQLYLAPKVIIRYHLMQWDEDAGQMKEVEEGDDDYSKVPEDDALYLIAPTLPEGATVNTNLIDESTGTDKGTLVVADTVVGYSYWHASKGSSTEDWVGYYKSGEPVKLTEEMIDPANTDTRRKGNDATEYPVIDLYAFAGSRLTIEKDVEDEGFLSGTFYFTVQKTDKTDGGNATDYVYFKQVNNDAYAYTEVEKGTSGATCVLPLRVVKDDNDAKDALELFKLVKGEDITYTVKEISAEDAKKLDSSLSGNDNIRHNSETNSAIDITFADYEVEYEWKTEKSADNSAGAPEHKGDRAANANGVEVTMSEDEKATVTVYNHANFYLVKHYVADLTSAGDAAPTVTNDPNKYPGYVPLLNDDGKAVIAKATFAPASPDATPEPPTYAELNEAFKNTSAPGSGKIEDHGIYASVTSGPDAQEANYTYGDLIYAGSTTPLPQAQLSDGEKHEVYINVGGNTTTSERLDTNKKYLEDHAKNNVSNPVGAGATVAVYWNRMLTFELESDERNVTAEFLEKTSANPPRQQNGQKKNNIRQSKIMYDTEYVLWDLLKSIVGGTGDPKYEDQVIMDSWQQYNAIDVQYRNSEEYGYIFHSIITEQVSTKTNPDSAEVTDTLITADNTRGGSDGTNEGSPKTKIYLTPQVKLRYHTWDADAEEYELYTATDTNTNTVFTVDPDLTDVETTASYKQTKNKANYATSFTPAAPPSGYSGWMLYSGEDDGVALSSKMTGTTCSIADLLNATWKAKNAGQKYDNTSKVLYIDLYSSPKAWTVEKSVSYSDGDDTVTLYGEDNEDLEIAAETKLTYSIVVENTGSMELNGLNVFDDFIIDETTQVVSFEVTTSVGSNAKCEKDATSGVYVISNLKPGETITLTMEYTLKAEDRGLTNTAVVTDKDDSDDDTDSDHTSTVEITIKDDPAWTVKKTAYLVPLVTDPNPELKELAKDAKVDADRTIQYQIVVKNTGNVALTGLSLSDVFEVDEADASGELNDWISSLDTDDEKVDKENFTLAVGATITFYVTYKVDSSNSSLVNTATVNQPGGKYEKTDPPSSTTTNGVNDKEAWEVKKLVNGKESLTDLEVGDELEYTITVTNTGNVTLEKLYLNDTFNGVEEELEYKGLASNLAADETKAEFDSDNGILTNLAKGETVTLTYTYTVQPTDKKIENRAIVNETDDFSKWDQGHESHTTAEVEGGPEISVTKTAYMFKGTSNKKIVKGNELTDDDYMRPGDKIVYEIVIENTGNVDLTNVSVKDKLNDKNFSFAKDISDCEWTANEYATVTEKALLNNGVIAKLEPSGKVTITYTYTVQAGDKALGNKVTVTTDDPDVSGEAETSTDVASIAVEKTVTSSPTQNGRYEVGDTITYKIKVTNTGSRDLYSVTIKDTMSKGSATFDKNDSLYTRSNSNRTATLKDALAPGKSVTLTVRHKVTEDFSGSLRNTADVEGRVDPNSSSRMVKASNHADLSNAEPAASPSPAPTYDVIPFSFSGRKTWVDNGDAEGLRPSQITVVVMQNGVPIQSQVVTAESGWTYTFTDLPDKDPVTGEKYVYTVGEETVPGYIGHAEFYDLVNELASSVVPGLSDDDPKNPFGPGAMFDPNDPDHSQSGFVGTDLTEELLERAIKLFEYGTPIWGELLETGDEMPIYPFIFGGVGLAAVIVLLVTNRKKRKKK